MLEQDLLPQAHLPQAHLPQTDTDTAASGNDVRRFLETDADSGASLI